MKKLHFNSTLNHKASDYKPCEICVERVVTLYGRSFEELKNHLMHDDPYIVAYRDLMYTERPLQRKRRYQLMKLGFPVLCIDRMPQIKPFITAALSWTPGTAFPDGIGAKIPDLEMATLPAEMDDFGETLEPIDPEDLIEFYTLVDEDGGDAL